MKRTPNAIRQRNQNRVTGTLTVRLSEDEKWLSVTSRARERARRCPVTPL